MRNITKFSFVEQDRPVLRAELKGEGEHSGVYGIVYVYTLPNGVYVQGNIEGLPSSSNFSFHVHEGLECKGPGEKILILPDLMSDMDGKASTQTYLDRVNSTQIAGRPMVLHLKADGQEPQIACGLLSRVL